MSSGSQEINELSAGSPGETTSADRGPAERQHPKGDNLGLRSIEVSAAHKRRLYEIWLALGNVSHVLGNECDPDKGNELLEPIMDQLQEMWK